MDSLTGQYLGQNFVYEFDTIYSIFIKSTGYHGWVSGIVEDGINGPLGMAVGADQLVKHKLPYFKHDIGSGIDVSSLGTSQIFVGCDVDNSLTHEISIVGSITG